MNLLLLALAPGIAIMLFIYTRDKYNREPLKNLLYSFLLGIASTLPAIVIQWSLQPVLQHHFGSKNILYYAVFAWLLVGLSEEGSKFLVLRLYAYPRKAFDEPFDGIVYSAMIGMGFASFENILYVTSHGYVTAFLRMFLSVPAHASFAVLMGYHAGLAKFSNSGRALHLLKGLLLAILFHGAFDFFLFLQQSPEITRYLSAGLLTLGALVSYWIGLRMSLKLIRIQAGQSKFFNDAQNQKPVT